MRVIWGAICDIKIIQPRWAIEEYAKILRNWVWFRPPHPPISVDESASVVRRRGWVKFAVCIISASGASFCHVERINPVVIVMPCSTSGSQR